MKEETKGDPRVSFDTFGGKVRTSYTSQQLTELYPHSKRALMTKANGRADRKHEFYSDWKEPALKYVATPEHQDAVEARITDLRDKARRRIANFDYGPYDKVAHLHDDMKNAMKNKNAQESAKCLLDIFEGVVIGETHGVPDAKQFLVDNMESLKDNGVNTLYLEHFRHNEYQSMIDEYMTRTVNDSDESAAGSLSPLEKAVRTMDNGKPAPYNLQGILSTAKEHGVRVVGIDDLYAKRLRPDGRPDTVARVARMNTLAHDIITVDDKDARGNGKYMVLVGSAHSNTHDGGIPGLSQMLKIPATVVPASGHPLELDPETKPELRTPTYDPDNL